MKAYLMVLNNALANSVDSATVKLHTDTDGLIDEVECLNSMGITPMEDDGLMNDNVLVEAAEKYSTMGTVSHLVYENVESHDTITDIGGEFVSCTYYPCYDQNELYEHIRVFMSDHVYGIAVTWLYQIVLNQGTCQGTQCRYS